MPIKERILKFLKEICESEEKRVEIEKNLQNIYGDVFSFEISKVKKIYKNIVENKDKLKNDLIKILEVSIDKIEID